jgi:hypothetical protein
MLKTTIFSLLAIVSITATAQKTPNNNGSLGFGVGQDYGGIGIRAEYLVHKNVGLFFGGGYNLIDVSFNTGVSVKTVPGKKVQPIIALMYGYNGVIKVKNRADLSKTYYGFTTGAGVQIENKKNARWLLQLLVPVGRQQFNEDYERLKTIVQFQNKPLPITFSVGHQISLNRGKK